MMKHVEDEHGNAGKHDSNDQNVPVVDQTEEYLPVEKKRNDLKCDKCDYETPLEEDLRGHYDSIHQGSFTNHVSKQNFTPFSHVTVTLTRPISTIVGLSQTLPQSADIIYGWFLRPTT